jgi:DNA adenine methylase
MGMSNDMPDRPSRLVHFTPLRYPGGKGKLAAYVKRLITENGLSDGLYVEPYAGGAAIALELLLQQYVSRIHINDVSRPVFAFWHSVLATPSELIRRVLETPLTVEEWDRQKAVFRHQDQHDYLDVGFATFFLNRTNRSGILNAGIIGGRAQSGEWKIDARYNRGELANRIDAIARQSDRITLTNADAACLIAEKTDEWPEKTLIYLDPPYFEKGRDLYYDFYRPEDHAEVAETIKQVSRQRWIVSYDDVPEIRGLYEPYRSIGYRIGYSARSSRKGSEVMFFDDTLRIPSLSGPIMPSDEPVEQAA